MTLADGRVPRENLIAWFEGSKVVDAQGTPLLVYHGTTSSFEDFRPRARNPDIGFHFGNLAQAHYFAGFNAHDRSRSGGNIVPAYLRVSSPIETPDVFGGRRKNIGALAEYLRITGLIDTRVRDRATYAKTVARGWEVLKDALKKTGCDGLVYRNRYEGTVHAENRAYVVFDTVQIWFALSQTSWVAVPEAGPLRFGSRGLLRGRTTKKWLGSFCP